MLTMLLLCPSQAKRALYRDSQLRKKSDHFTVANTLPVSVAQLARTEAAKALMADS